MFPGMPTSLSASGGSAGPAKSGDVFSTSSFGGDFNVATGGGGVGLNKTTIAILAGAAVLMVIVWKKFSK